MWKVNLKNLNVYFKYLDLHKNTLLYTFILSIFGGYISHKISLQAHCGHKNL